MWNQHCVQEDGWMSDRPEDNISPESLERHEAHPNKKQNCCFRDIC